MDIKETALNILERDKINNISIINFIENNRILSIDIAGNSILAKGRSDRTWIYISSYSEHELQILQNKLTNDDVNFGAVDDWMIPILIKGKAIIWDIPVLQFYLPDNADLPSAEYKTSQLEVKDAITIYNNYSLKEYVSIEYITERIRKGISAGIYENNKLVSWGMTQDDGAIGFLHTLENFRKKGYGYNVTLSLIDQLQRNHKLPFAYIEPSNKKSINLFGKLGFKENKKAHWLQIK